MNTKSSPLQNKNYYIIDTRTVSNKFKGRQIEVKDYTKNPEYAALIKAEEERTLADMFPRLRESIASVASNFHSDRMANDSKCDVAQCDDEGFLFFTLDRKDECIKLLAQLQVLDRDIHISRYGRQLDEPVEAKK